MCCYLCPFRISNTLGHGRAHAGGHLFDGRRDVFVILVCLGDALLREFPERYRLLYLRQVKFRNRAAGGRRVLRSPGLGGGSHSFGHDSNPLKGGSSGTGRLRRCRMSVDSHPRIDNGKSGKSHSVQDRKINDFRFDPRTSNSGNLAPHCTFYWVQTPLGGTKVETLQLRHEHSQLQSVGQTRNLELLGDFASDWRRNLIRQGCGSHQHRYDPESGG